MKNVEELMDIWLNEFYDKKNLEIKLSYLASLLALE